MNVTLPTTWGRVPIAIGSIRDEIVRTMAEELMRDGNVKPRLWLVRGSWQRREAMALNLGDVDRMDEAQQKAAVLAIRGLASTCMTAWIVATVTLMRYRDDGEVGEMGVRALLVHEQSASRDDCVLYRVDDVDGKAVMGDPIDWTFVPGGLFSRFANLYGQVVEA